MRFSWYEVQRFLASLIIFVGLSALVFSYFFSAESRSETKPASPTSSVLQTAVGMELRGCRNEDAWLKNTSEHSVRVRWVWQLDNAEQTSWMREVKPGEVVRVGFSGVPAHYGLYIYNLDGGLIGFISGNCPPKK